jgi:hypothetical protein
VAPAKRTATGQGALFEVPPTPKRRRPAPVPIEWPGGIRPWDPIDAADTELGWEYRWVTPRRAVEIRREISRG